MDNAKRFQLLKQVAIVTKNVVMIWLVLVDSAEIPVTAELALNVIRINIEALAVVSKVMKEILISSVKQSVVDQILSATLTRLVLMVNALTCAWRKIHVQEMPIVSLEITNKNADVLKDTEVTHKLNVEQLSA
jgi:hypothetical protein